MKSKDLLKVIVIGIIIAGVAAAAIYILFKRKEKKRVDKEEIKPIQADRISPDAAFTKAKTDVNDSKKNAADDISSRHREASKIMRESVDKIFKEDETQDEGKPSENEEKLDEIMKDLEDM